jgi:hypothetical protein
MALNLLRNSRVFFTTNVNSTTGEVALTGGTASNTFEIQVLDGFSFNQNTTQETVTVTEAGATPNRGQRSFNTALDPVEWSITTYIRPRYTDPTPDATIDTQDKVDAEESVLWNAFASSTGNAWSQTAGVPTTTRPFSTVSFGNSNLNQFQKFGMVIVFDDITYIIDNCALESASIDFGLDAIAQIAWTGRGTKLRSVAKTTIAAPSGGTETITGGFAGTAKARDTGAGYIANKLSTMTITRKQNTAYSQGTDVSYTVALTGGNLTINNNITYLTPANLGTVNQPITYFSGTRAITSNVTAYLNTGATNSAGLLSDLLTQSATSPENLFDVTLVLGGTGNDNRVEIAMPTTMLAIPTISTEQIISTTINMFPQASTGSGTGITYDVGGTNELTLKYYAGPVV